MSISDTDASVKKHYRRSVTVYLALSVFCAVFGAVYEHFSHDVFSAAMTFAFLCPLIGGVLPFPVISALRRRRQAKPLRPSRLAYNLYNAGIATLTVGSMVYGALEIYGTQNPLVYVYPAASAALLLAAAIVRIRLARRRGGQCPAARRR